ncbi:MAG: thrombospondin type 3 repeat-containing protein [Deinococcales bacterium]
MRLPSPLALSSTKDVKDNITVNVTAVQDSDGDGLNDDIEANLGTDPNKADNLRGWY